MTTSTKIYRFYYSAVVDELVVRSPIRSAPTPPVLHSDTLTPNNLQTVDGRRFVFATRLFALIKQLRVPKDVSRVSFFNRRNYLFFFTPSTVTRIHEFSHAGRIKKNLVASAERNFPELSVRRTFP